MNSTIFKKLMLLAAVLIPFVGVVSIGIRSITEYASADGPPEGPTDYIGYWPLDEASANTCTGGVNDACDASGLATDGQWIGNATSTTGRFTNAVTFDGTGDHIDMSGNVSASTVYTVSMWINLTPGDFNAVAAGFFETGNINTLIYFGQSTNDCFGFNSWNTDCYGINGAAALLADGDWHHIVATFHDSDITNNDLWIDTVSQSLAQRVGTSNNEPLGESFHIGNRGDTNTTWNFNGKIDEVKVYDRALTQEEIDDLFNSPPTASFTATPTSGNADLDVDFDATASSDMDGTITDYDWDFGDGNLGTGAITSHTYTDDGVYTVTLTVTDNLGGTDTDTETITVSNPLPTADFNATPTSGMAPLEVDFDASDSTDTNGTIVSYEWDFDDGDTGTGVTTSHTFLSADTFSVVLTVTDNHGGTDTHSVDITVTGNQAPTADAQATPTSGDIPLLVNFDGSASSDSDGTIASYEWDFGDGDTGTGATPSHTFTTAGTYNVVLTVTDDDGATDTDTVVITATENQLPVASIDATPTEGEAPLQVDFDATASTDPDGTIESYEWDFDNGETTSGDIVTATFTEAGVYNVLLTVTDNDGAEDSATVIITVAEGEQDPEGSISTGLPGNKTESLTVTFDASDSVDPDGGEIVSYEWDFGDGTTGSGAIVTHTYASPGEYTVILTITDDEGAILGVSIIVTVGDGLASTGVNLLPYTLFSFSSLLLLCLWELGSEKIRLSFLFSKNFDGVKR